MKFWATGGAIFGLFSLATYGLAPFLMGVLYVRYGTALGPFNIVGLLAAGLISAWAIIRLPTLAKEIRQEWVDLFKKDDAE